MKPMEAFKNYLIKQGYTNELAQDKINYVQHYLSWLRTHHLEMEQIRYADVMNYIGQLQQEGNSPHQQNRRLLAIETYYTFRQLPSSVQGLRVKVRQSTLKPVLELQELESVYHHYEPWHDVAQLMLSLVVWQALERDDILRIELQDINLTKGQLYIKSHHQRQARYMKLEAHQIMQLHDYITATKAKREKEKHERLILSLTPSRNSLLTTWRRLNQEVVQQAHSKLNISIRNLEHLRQSRLAQWVKQYGLRQAQYLGGFKSVRGVEYYQTQSLKDLQQQLEQCHPLQ
jgi:integrase/recombinase XerD